MRLRMEGGAAPEEWVGLLMQPESQLFCPASLPSTPCLCQCPRTGHCKSGSTTHLCQLVGHLTHATWSRSKAPWFSISSMERWSWFGEMCQAHANLSVGG